MNIAIILASGIGERMHESAPKQFLLLNEKPLLLYSVETFNNHKEIDKVLVVTNEDKIDYVKELTKEYKKVMVTKGGKTRKESAYLGLQFLKDLGVGDEDIVLIHDAARIFVSEDIISRNIEGAKKYSAVITAIPSSDTIASVLNKEYVVDYPNRENMFLVQTPQSFKYGLILKAHEIEENASSDDGQLILKIDAPLHVVLGHKLNFKITTPEDLLFAKYLLNSK